MKADIKNRASFDMIRYAQVWEDADLLVEALDIKENDTVLSIASGGDNTFALLAQNPAKVYALDLSNAQIACCHLRVCMYKHLSHREHLLFGGVVRGDIDRIHIYNTILKPHLTTEVQFFWEANLDLIEKGFMTQGKFENYFKMFREHILPIVHNKRRIKSLTMPRSVQNRKLFYARVWNNKRWSIMFKLFFSRFMMGRLGRDKEFFKYVHGSVADRILKRTKYALTVLDPSQNPYLHFIVNGYYETVFPFSLREENYESIKKNLHKLEIKLLPIEEFITSYKGEIDAYNLSDIFEYMSEGEMDKLYEHMIQKSSKGCRIAYWNMLAPRSLSYDIRTKYGITTDKEKNMYYLKKDKAFFYSKFYLDIKEM